MRFMVSGATTSMEEFARDEYLAPYLGAMVTPNTGNNLDRMLKMNLPWCIDNAAFDSTKFSRTRYLQLVRKAMGVPVRPTFITVPDQVGNHECTVDLFFEWMRAFYVERIRGLPWAFVIQDGIEDAGHVPWDHIQAVFIGGTDDLKDDTVVTCEIIPEAKRLGKHVHMGRVNTKSRMHLAISAGVDSVDGGSLSMFPKTYIPKFVDWARELEHRDRMLDLAACDLRLELSGMEASQRCMTKSA